MISEQDKLKIGVEVDGKTHFDFTLRPQLVRDSVEAFDDPAARDNEAYAGLVMRAKQITSLGDLKPEQITPDLLMNMHDVDMAIVMEAGARLQARLNRFRDGVEEPAKAAPGANEGGVSTS